MGTDDLTTVIWRRKGTFTTVAVTCMVLITALSLLLPKQYEATATIFVAPPAGPTLDITQSEQIARTYTALASNPSVAEEVLPKLGLSLTRDELLGRMSFAPVERTQLIQITAQGDSPEEAVQIANTYASVFVARAESTNLTAGAKTRVTISDPAVEPTSASSPNIPLYLGFGLLLSLLLGFAAAVARDRLDRRLRITAEDDSLFDVAIIARVPHVSLRRGGRDGQAPELADALRVLRTNIELAAGANRALLVTSSGIGEGKTTIASNLAIAMAADGDRVALVECDLRRPTLSSVLGDAVPDRQTGLSAYLAGQSRATDIMLTNRQLPAMSVVPAGPPVAQPGRLLRTPRMRELLQALRQGNDWVLLDGPPISVGDDALVLSALVDGTLFVVDPRRTTAGAARAGLATLRTVDAQLPGVVVNNLGHPRSDYYQMAGVDAGGTAAGQRELSASGG